MQGTELAKIVAVVAAIVLVVLFVDRKQRERKAAADAKNPYGNKTMYGPSAPAVETPPKTPSFLDRVFSSTEKVAFGSYANQAPDNSQTTMPLFDRPSCPKETVCPDYS